MKCVSVDLRLDPDDDGIWECKLQFQAHLIGFVTQLAIFTRSVTLRLVDTRFHKAMALSLIAQADDDDFEVGIVEQDGVAAEGVAARRGY